MAEVCLAERRKKQKWSSDPRGNSWSKDKNKFGYRMLEKMGWSDGSGLGADEDGRTTHVKISYKNNTNGLGTTEQHADDWIEHQTGFDGLLASLQQQQQGGSGSEPGSASQSGRSSPSAGLRAKALKSRARINYNKFLRGKDISGYSNTDMSCILGVRSTASEGASSYDVGTTDQQRESDGDSPDSGSSSDSSSESSSGTSKAKSQATEDSTTGLYTTVSGQSVQDYFAAKMAKLRRGPLPEAAADDDDVDVQSPVAVKRKRKSSREEADDSDDDNDSNEAPPPKKKKKKKSEKVKSKSKKSKSKPAVVEQQEDRPSSDEEIVKKKKKKKSKKAN